jgi:autophagy-related protein 18
MKLLHTIKDTPPNPNGLCALSANSDNCYLAYPANNANGEVHIFDAQNLQNKIIIAAHDNPLAAVAFDSNGLKIATASEKGTVIRVFNVLDALCIYEFRRGYARCVTIYSLSFSADSLFLCASSNTETVHIFKLEDLTEVRNQEEPQGLLGYISNYGRKALAQSASYWPSVADMMNQWRSFAIARLPLLSGSRNVCAVANIQKIPRVLIASADGYLYIYDLNVNEGGDCTLIKQHRLDEISNAGGDASSAACVQEPSRASPRSESVAEYDGEFPPMFTPGF